MVTGNKFLWAAALALFVLSSGVWADVWDPDADPNLIFNMDFEKHHDLDANDAVYDLVGDVENLADDNTPWAGPNALFGTSFNVGSPVDLGNTDMTSCRLTINEWLHMEENYPRFESVFNLGPDANTVLTFSAWFGHHDGSGTFIGSKADGSTDYWWQFRMIGGKIAMDDKYATHDVLRMATQETLLEMGMNYTDWHHATVVFDRRTRESSKIYIDGAPVKVDITGHDANLPGSHIPPDPCVFIGGGNNGLFDDWDGLLDEIRIYNRVLNDNEISLLYQWAPGKTGPWAVSPRCNYTQVTTNTGLEWEPISPNSDSQDVIFGTDPLLASGVITLHRDGDVTSVTNANIGGQLDFNEVYYWRVDSNDGAGGMDAGDVWKFTTDIGNAFDPVPVDGATGVAVNNVDLQWTGSPDAVSFDVYWSTDENLDPNTHEGPVADSNVVILTSADAEKGGKYYWQVVTNFAGGSKKPGPPPIWDFRVGYIPIVINTADFNEAYDGVDYNALSMTFTDSCDYRNGTLMSDDVVRFDFGGTLDIGEKYEVVVIPRFTDAVQDRAHNLTVRQTSRPMALHVEGDFIFDGRMDISGETLIVTTADDKGTRSPYGRCGGYRGPRNNNGDAAVSPEEAQYGGYWHGTDSNDRFDDALQGTHENTGRFIHFISSVPAGAPTRYGASGLSMFGPGGASSGAQNTGGGGGYGGVGGDSGHGWDFGNFEGGVPYGDNEVPVPFGGSAGGFGKNADNPSPGGSGGGGVEIYATGDIVIGPHAAIVAEGASAYNGCSYAGGGGAGGSVRMITPNNVEIAETAVISVDGGNGGNTTTGDEEKAAGGGAGGRVAIWYGSGKSLTGKQVITANGGTAGIISGGAPSYAEPGQNGTIFDSNGDPRKASAPTPRNGDKNVYVAGAGGNLTLKWYSGFGAQGVNDVVYFGTNPVPGGAPVATVAATRGQHSAVVAVVNGGKYSWKVKTGGAVDSDIWSFSVVNWYCDQTKFNQTAQWDSGPYCDCIEDLKDFAYFANYWYLRDNMEVGPEGAGVSKFISEWLWTGGRTP